MPKRVVHFQCLKDDDRKDTEISGLKRNGGLTAQDELLVLEPFKEPVSRGVLGWGPTHITIGGSGWSVWEDIPHLDGLRDAVKAACDLKLPVLGICFGGQFLADLLGGKVVRDEALAEYGTTEIRVSPAAALDPLFAPLPKTFLVQSSHHDRIARVPPGCARLATSQGGRIIQAFALLDGPIYGVQFHPERSCGDARKLLEPKHCDYPEERAAAIRTTLRESPFAEKLLHDFFRI